MPFLTDYDELDLTGMEIDTIDFKVERLSADFGAGYRADAVVGGTFPLWGWQISSDALPDDDSYNELIEGKSRFAYYSDFILDHTVGDRGAIFIIDFRGRKYTAAFAENNFSGVMETYDVFGLSGVKLKYARVRDLKYNADGSVYLPWGWYDSAYSFEGVADGTAITSWPDRWGNGHDLTLSSGTTAEVELVDKPLSYVRFNGSNARKMLSSPVRFYDIFLSLGVRGTTWGGAARACLSDGTTTFLQGATGTAHFEDLSLTSYEYRKNNVLLTAAGASPMNVYAVLHLRFTAGQTFATVLDIAESYSSGFNAPLNVAEMIFCDEQLNATQYAAVVTGMLEKLT